MKTESIALMFDENYSTNIQWMLFQLNMLHETRDIFVLYDSHSVSSKTLDNVRQHIQNLNVIMYDCHELVVKLNIMQQNNNANYPNTLVFKFLIPIICADYEYTLYLDSDLCIKAGYNIIFQYIRLINKLIKSKKNHDFMFEIAGVRDISALHCIQEIKTAGFKYEKTNYINTGVMVFNNPNINKNFNFIQNIIDVTFKYNFKYLDQDSFNIFFNILEFEDTKTSKFNRFYQFADGSQYVTHCIGEYKKSLNRIIQLLM